MQSEIDFGEPQQSKIRDIDELVQINVLDDFYWSQFNTGVSIGKPTESSAFGYQYQGEKYELTV